MAIPLTELLSANDLSIWNYQYGITNMELQI